MFPNQLSEDDMHDLIKRNEESKRKSKDDAQAVSKASKTIRRKSRNKAAALAALGGCCIRCGSTDDLQFIHKDPATKLGNVSQMFQKGFEILMKEVLKCELVCRECTTQASKKSGAPSRVSRKITIKEAEIILGLSPGTFPKP